MKGISNMELENWCLKGRKGLSGFQHTKNNGRNACHPPRASQLFKQAPSALSHWKIISENHTYLNHCLSELSKRADGVGEEILLRSLRPVYTCDFWCDFCRAIQCNFCRKCKLAVISLRFMVRCLLQFPTNRCQVASSFEYVRKKCDIAATNCTEIALKSPLVYMRDVMMQLERNKNSIEKCD